MKTWMWILLGLIVVFLFLGYLYDQGLINTNWQWLSIILAAAAGPFEFLRKVFKGDSISTKKLMEKQSLRQAEVLKHRQVYDKIIERKEKRIQELEAQVMALEDELDRLELELKNVDEEVDQMDLSELQDEFINEYGN